MTLRLNLPLYDARIKAEGKRTLIFDPVRKKYVTLTPEEWVRQHVINYLVTEKSYPVSLISVEKPLKFAGLDKRSDLLVSDRNGKPLMIIECKAPEVTITQKVFEQIAIYNLAIKANNSLSCGEGWGGVPYIMVTNGMQHYCLIAATENSPARFLNEIPEYAELINQSLNPKPESNTH